MSAERPQEFDPTSRWIELSLPDGTPEGKIRRIAQRIADHLFEGPKIENDSYVFVGTRSMVLVEIEGDRDLHPDDQLTLKQARERRFVSRALAEAETPHQWLIVSMDQDSI